MSGVVIRALDAAGAMCVGCFHPAEPVPYPAGAWTPKELELLRADPALEVVDADDAPAAAGAPADADPGPLAHLTPSHVAILAECDSGWLDRLISVTTLQADQIDRLVELETDGVAALLDPPAPLLQDILDRATEALRAAGTDRGRRLISHVVATLGVASVDEIAEFVGVMRTNPIVAAIAWPDPADAVDGGTTEEEPSRHEKLVAACAGLDPKNPDHWLSDGTTPSIEALEAATGIDDVTAAERTAAHNEHVKREGEALTGG